MDLNRTVGSHTKKIERSMTNMFTVSSGVEEGRTTDELPTATGVSFRLLSNEAHVIQDESFQDVGIMDAFCGSGVSSEIWWGL